MTTVLWLLAALSFWLILSGLIGIAVGKVIHFSEQQEVQHPFGQERL